MGGRLGGVTLAAAAAVALAVPAGAAAERLNSYKVKLGKATNTVETLARQGFDVTEGGKGRSIEIVATATQARKLRADGVRARLTRAKGGRTALRAHMAAEPGWQVWRPYLRTDVALSGDAGNPKDNLVTQLQKLEQKPEARGPAADRDHAPAAAYLRDAGDQEPEAAQGRLAARRALHERAARARVARG